jgi:transposase
VRESLEYSKSGATNIYDLNGKGKVMKQYIGVDVGKFELDLYDGDKYFKFKNSAEGIKELITQLGTENRNNLFVIFEATGGYEQMLGELLAESNIKFKRVHPNKVRHYAKSLGSLAKTDKLDAKLLMMFGEGHALEQADKLLGKETAELKALLVRREQLLDEKTREINRIDKIVNQVVKKSLERHLEWLETEIKQLEKQTKDFFKQTPALQETVKLYESIKGVGFLTAAYLVTHLPELGKIEHAQLTALVGLAPMNADSGKKKGKRSIQAGRAGIRKVLYMAALSAVRYNKDIRAFYTRLRSKGKLFKVSIAAAMRKLIIMANSVAKRGTPWQESLKMA